MLLKNMGQPFAGWMRAKVSALDDEEGFRPFHNERAFRRCTTTKGTPLDARLSKMARPKKVEQEKRSEQTKERWTIAELAYVEEQARNAGLSRAEYIRRRSLSLPVRPAPSVGASDPALVSELNRIGVNLNQIAKYANAGRGSPHSLAAVQDELHAALAKVLGHGS